MHPRFEEGLCVEISDDGRNVLMTLDPDHAEELARILSTLAIDQADGDAWFKVGREATHDTWLGTMLRLIACAQNLQRSSPVM